MQSRAKRTFVVLAALAVLGAMALYAWLPWDPFEGPAGPLDELVPRDVDSAWRFDGPSLLHSPFAVAAWSLPEVAELRAAGGLDERTTAPFRRIEAAFSFTAGIVDPPSLERDLVPAEVVVATRGDDVLVVSRISARARAVEIAKRLPEQRARSLGLSVEGDLLVVRDGAAAPVYVAIHRDVLLASTARRFVSDAVNVAERGRGGLSGRPDFRDALALDPPARAAPSRILGWLRPGPMAQRLAPKDGSSAPAWLGVVAAPGAQPLRCEIDLSSAKGLGVTLRLAWDDGLPKSLAAFDAPESQRVADLTATAAGLAPPGEGIVVGGIAVRAAGVLRALLGSQPPERQSAFDEALAAAGESVETIADSLSSHFEDGVGFVVARVSEADQVLGGDDAGAVHAIPATLVAFRCRRPGVEGRRALLDDLHRRARTIFGAEFGDTVDVLPDGTRIHVLERAGLAGQWDLLSPAFAFRGDEFVFSTHAGFLRRAVARRVDPDAGAPSSVAPGAAALPPVGGTTLACAFRSATLRRWVADQAWEAADQATWRDWPAERAKVEASIPPGSKFRPQDRETYVDARIREIKRRRRAVEIPEAVAAWTERWKWLDGVGDASVESDLAPDGLTLRVRMGFRE